MGNQTQGMKQNYKRTGQISPGQAFKEGGEVRDALKSHLLKGKGHPDPADASKLRKGGRAK